MNDKTQGEDEFLVKLGLHKGISNAEYHHGPGISKSALDLINRSPAHYITHKKHPKPSIPAYMIGSALHKLVLEPDSFDSEYVVLPHEAPLRPTARQMAAKKPSAATEKAIAWWKEWEQEVQDKIILTNSAGSDPFWNPGDWDLIQYMRDAVFEHPLAKILLEETQGEAEPSCFWIDSDTRKLCKCRPDFLNHTHNLCIDLKTSSDASLSEFTYSCAKYRYHVQDAWYTHGLRMINHAVDGFVFVVVEKQPPYGVGLYVLDEESRRAGRLEFERNLRTYAECHTSDEWPSYPKEIREISLSPWQRASKIG